MDRSVTILHTAHTGMLKQHFIVWQLALAAGNKTFYPVDLNDLHNYGALTDGATHTCLAWLTVGSRNGQLSSQLDTHAASHISCMSKTRPEKWKERLSAIIMQVPHNLISCSK